MGEIEKSELETSAGSAGSGEFLRSAESLGAVAERVAATLDAPPVEVAEPAEVSPVFAELREPKLPRLERQDRAWLQIQTPTRLYFYWSLRSNPFHTVKTLFGDHASGYTLVVRLLDLTHDRHEMRPAPADGNWWFDADPNTEYRAEVGLYAPNRPYVRIVYSNTVTTPRSGPSPKVAADSDWVVTSERFSRVLDAAGFRRDAMDVAAAGDDASASEEAIRAEFGRFFSGDLDFKGYTGDDVRFALSSIGDGRSLESIKWEIGATLFALLERSVARLSSEEAQTAARELAETYDFEEVQLTAAFGASLVHFPKTTRLRRRIVASSPVGRDA